MTTKKTNFPRHNKPWNVYGGRVNTPLPGKCKGTPKKRTSGRGR